MNTIVGSGVLLNTNVTVNSMKEPWCTLIYVVAPVN